MNLEFETLKAKNFLSFGNKEEVFDLSFQGVTNLKGQNLDIDVGKDNSSRNGTGKTSVLQAVVYALYGKGIEEGMKQDEFINLTNGKDMRVQLDFSVDGKECSIVRSRKPNGVRFFVDGDDVSRDTIANTNDLIEQTIRINYDTFVVSFLMTNGVKPVLSRKPAEQRDFFERLLNMDLLSERANSVKSIKSELNVDLKLKQKDIENADETNQKADDQYERVKQKHSQYEEDRKVKLEDLNNKIETCQSVKNVENKGIELFDNLSNEKSKKNELVHRKSDLNSKINDLSQAINDANKHIDNQTKDIETQKSRLQHLEESINSLLSSLNDNHETIEDLKPLYDQVGDYLDLKEKLDSENESIEALDKEFKKAVSEKDDMTEKLNHLKDGNCPYCKQQWNTPEQQQKVEQLESDLEQNSKDITDIESKIVSHKENKEKIETQINAYELDDDRAEEIIDQYETAQTSYDQNQKRLEEERSSYEKVNQKIQELETFMNEELSSVYGEIEDNQKEKERVQEELDGVGDSLEQVQSRIEETEKEISELPITDEDQFKKAISNYDHYKEQLEEAEKDVNPFEEDYRAGPQGKVNVDDIKAEKDSVESKIRHCDYMIKLLTDSKSFIRKSIINRYIPYLNKKINTYAESLDSPHFTEIQSDLTVDVEYMRKSVSYHSLSAGERLRLNVSVSLALRDLMATLGTSSDFLMVDELFDSSLDSNGKVNVFNTIKQRLDKVILVSHSGEFDDKCDRVVTAVKQNGFTRLE